MYTILYKNFYIHGYCDKPLCIAQIGGNTYNFKSLLAAKRFITKLLKVAK